MLKYYFSIILFGVLLLIYCKAQPGQTVLKFAQVFTNINTIEIPETVDMSGDYISVRYKDENSFFTSDYLTKKLHQVFTETKEIKEIGKLGQGPGEYLAAFDFDFENDELYFNDRKSSRLQSLNLKTNEINELTVKPTILHDRFVKIEGNFYFLNWGSAHDFYIYDQNRNGLFVVPTIFKEMPFPVMNSAIVKAGRDLYFLNSHESVIYKYDTAKQKETEIKIKNLKKYLLSAESDHSADD